MEPSRRSKPVTIAIPSSLTSDIPHLREKTTMVGQIGRAAAVFRVEHIIIYRDPSESKNEERLVKKLLEYIDTPQYLRKSQFPLDSSMAYAGLLHPLRTPHHPNAKRVNDLHIGDIRKGIVVGSGKAKTMIDIGVKKLIAVASRESLIGQIQNVRITQIEPELEGTLVEDREIRSYWGFDVTTARSLAEYARHFRPGLTVATSRKGSQLQESLMRLRNKWVLANSFLLAFGSPRNGLAEMLRAEGAHLGDTFDFTLNFIPNQGSQTVRTEEALLCTLGIVNVLLDSGSD